MQKLKRTIIYLLLTIIILLLFFALLRPKNDETLIVAADFYKEENNSLDVIFLGSSRNVMNVNPAVIFEKEGIKSFAYGGMGQPIWNSYHYLVEALKHQDPEVIMLEVGMLSFEEQYADYNFTVKNTLGIRSLKNRHDNIKISAPSNMQIDLFLGFPIYHNRFTELTKADFTLGLVDDYITYKSYKGFIPSQSVVEFEAPYDNSADIAYELPQKNIDYLEKIIALCESEGINLVFFSTPDIITTTTNWSEMNDSIAQSVQSVADENNIPFLYCDELVYDIGIDYAEDFRDERHLNVLGSTKLSSFLATFLIENYDLTTYNGDTDWAAFSSKTKQALNY